MNILSLLHVVRTLLWCDASKFEEGGMLQVIGEYLHMPECCGIIENFCFLVVSPRECETQAAFSQDRGI